MKKLHIVLLSGLVIMIFSMESDNEKERYSELHYYEDEQYAEENEVFREDDINHDPWNRLSRIVIRRNRRICKSSKQRKCRRFCILWRCRFLCFYFTVVKCG